MKCSFAVTMETCHHINVPSFVYGRRVVSRPGKLASVTVEQRKVTVMTLSFCTTERSPHPCIWTDGAKNAGYAKTSPTAVANRPTIIQQMHNS